MISLLKNRKLLVVKDRLAIVYEEACLGDWRLNDLFVKESEAWSGDLMVNGGCGR